MNGLNSIVIKLGRRELLRSLALGGAALIAASRSPVFAQGFPSKSIRLIVPFPPGGPTDIVARPLAQMLSSRLSQQIFIENKGGAGGSIAADEVSKAPSDGYTLLIGTVGTHAINAALYPRLSYAPTKDFTPIGLAATAPVAVIVGSGTPYNSIGDLVAAAKKNPSSIVFGSAGNGTPGHLTGELFAKAAGIEIRHVPYKGSAPALVDLIGGQIPLMFDPVQSVLSHVQGGRLRALAISSKQRSSVLPSIPTLNESGLRGFEAEAWWAIFAPSGLPDAEASILRREVERVVHSNEFRDKLISLGMGPSTQEFDAFDSFHKAEIAKWGKAVRDSGSSIN